FLRKPCRHDPISMVTVLVSGNQAFPYLAAVRLDGPAGFFSELRVALDKLRLEVFDQPQKIVHDQHLSVAMGPRADADGRPAHGFGDHTREIRRADRKSTRLKSS